jgi:hypothetical protein|tara:strand:+ start:105 stop:380 length:276 start_codon:yes stop_codon:yes gene_type:complete
MCISTDIEKNSMVLFINIGGIMKIGDLVKYNDPRYPEWSSLVGIISRQIPGTAEYQRVIWNNGTHSTLPKKYLRRLDYGNTKGNFTKKQER